MKIDPSVQYCRCGMTWKPRWYHKILMLIFGEYSRRCQCGTKMTYQLINHVVKVNTEPIKDKERIWKNG